MTIDLINVLLAQAAQDPKILTFKEASDYLRTHYLIKDDSKYLDRLNDEKTETIFNDYRVGAPAINDLYKSFIEELKTEITEGEKNIMAAEQDIKTLHKVIHSDASVRKFQASIGPIISNITSHKYADMFMHPITDAIAPDYSKVIFQPIDIRTIKQKIKEGRISSVAEFERDIHLMCANAVMYNNPKSQVYEMAMEFADDVDQLMDEVLTGELS